MIKKNSMTEKKRKKNNMVTLPKDSDNMQSNLFYVEQSIYFYVERNGIEFNKVFLI